MLQALGFVVFASLVMSGLMLDRAGKPKFMPHLVLSGFAFGFAVLVWSVWSYFAQMGAAQ